MGSVLPPPTSRQGARVWILHSAERKPGSPRVCSGFDGIDTAVPVSSPFTAGPLAPSLMPAFVWLQIVFSSSKVGLRLFIKSKRSGPRGRLPICFPSSQPGPKSSQSEPLREVEWHLGGDGKVSPYGHDATAHGVHEPVQQAPCPRSLMNAHPTFTQEGAVESSR